MWIFNDINGIIIASNQYLLRSNIELLMLYVVSTPIGNLEDITYRAVRTLSESDLIICEDTRQTQKLLQRYEIKKPLLSYHSHSKIQRVDHIIDELQRDKNVSLVSDAGTPGISDPGFVLIEKAIEQGIKVVPVPGAAAFLTALAASGLPTHEFVYLGFLPHKKGRETMLKQIAAEDKTVVFYESPHRLLKALEQLCQFCPDKKIVVARELTKMFEEFFRGTVREAFEYFKNGKVLGEFVILVSQ